MILILCIPFIQCSNHSTPTKHKTPVDLTTVEKNLVESDNKFGLKLFREINQTQKDSNIIISPLSVSVCLGMVYNGADGKTKEDMQKILELEGLNIEEVNQSYQHIMELLSGLDPEVQFQIANSIWYRLNDLIPKEEFLSVCQKYFDALIKGMNFDDPGIIDSINLWVEENTNGKIKEIWEGKEISSQTIMFLVNAIYFKGAWTYQFDKNKTKDDLFYISDGSTKPCKMMEQRGFFKNFGNNTFWALDLPYGDGNYSMTIFLPHWGTDIDSLIAEFSQDNLNQWLSSFKNDSLNIYLPRFKLEYEKLLNEELKSLGMQIAFTPGAADFTKMYYILPGQVWIDTVLHKTFIEVDEKGTEAAAATIVEMIKGPSGFRVDHPFIFMIREKSSQTILFIGKILDPTYD